MARQERRKHRRVGLRLAVAELSGAALPGAGEAAWTTDISAGGMHISVPLKALPGNGEELRFELRIPPGAGYSPTDGRVAGSGRVVRAAWLAEGQAGVALRFSRPLAVSF